MEQRGSGLGKVEFVRSKSGWTFYFQPQKLDANDEKRLQPSWKKGPIIQRLWAPHVLPWEKASPSNVNDETNWNECKHEAHLDGLHRGSIAAGGGSRLIYADEMNGGDWLALMCAPPTLS